VGENNICHCTSVNYNHFAGMGSCIQVTLSVNLSNLLHAYWVVFALGGSCITNLSFIPRLNYILKLKHLCKSLLMAFLYYCVSLSNSSN